MDLMKFSAERMSSGGVFQNADERVCAERTLLLLRPYPLRSVALSTVPPRCSSCGCGQISLIVGVRTALRPPDELARGSLFNLRSVMPLASRAIREPAQRDRHLSTAPRVCAWPFRHCSPEKGCWRPARYRDSFKTPLPIIVAQAAFAGMTDEDVVSGALVHGIRLQRH